MTLPSIAAPASAGMSTARLLELSGDSQILDADAKAETERFLADTLTGGPQRRDRSGPARDGSSYAICIVDSSVLPCSWKVLRGGVAHFAEGSGAGSA